MKPRARTEKQADDAAGFEQGTIGRVTLSMGVAVAQEVEYLIGAPAVLCDRSIHAPDQCGRAANKWETSVARDQ